MCIMYTQNIHVARSLVWMRRLQENKEYIKPELYLVWGLKSDHSWRLVRCFEQTEATVQSNTLQMT